MITVLADLEEKPPTCTYIRYFTGDEEREGLGPTEAILCKYDVLCLNTHRVLIL